MDLFAPEVQDEAPPSLTVLTDMAVTTYQFNVQGVLERETAWAVSQPRGIYEAWILPSSHLLIKRPTTREGPQALQIVDQAGNVLWELKPEKEMLSVSFDNNRRFMIIEMLREARAYRLE